MKNTITQLPEVAGKRSRSVSTVMYDNSMENYIDGESAKLSIPHLSDLIANQVKLSDINQNKHYIVELQSGDISVGKIEQTEAGIEVTKLNPEYPNLSIAINQVKRIYEIYLVQQDRDNL